MRALDVTQEDFRTQTVKLAIYVQPVSTGTTTHTKNTVSALYASQELIKNFLTARRLRAKIVQLDFTLMLMLHRIASHVRMFLIFFIDVAMSTSHCKVFSVIFSLPSLLLSPGVPGTTNNIVGQSECSQCTAGKYMEIVQSTIPCKDCETGKFVVNDEASSCTNCAPGKWSDAIGLATDDCKDCIIGKYSAAQGAKADGDCVDCPPGTAGLQAGELNEPWSCVDA